MIWETGFKRLELPEIGKPRGGIAGSTVVLPPEEYRIVDEVDDFLMTETGDYLVWV
jgi:hypothetical protein